MPAERHRLFIYEHRLSVFGQPDTQNKGLQRNQYLMIIKKLPNE